MEDMVKGYLIGTGLMLLAVVCGMFLSNLAEYVIDKWSASREAKKIKAGMQRSSGCSSCSYLGICAMAEALSHEFEKNITQKEK